MPFGAAIGVSAAVGLGSSMMQSSAAKDASNQQVQAQQQALATITKILQPIISQGSDIASSAVGPLKALLTPGPNQTAMLSQLPGFQFAQDWGQKAVQNLGTTMGLGGNTLTAGANYATGLAQQGFGQLTGLLQGFLNSGLQTQTNAASALSSGSQSAISSIGNAQAAGTLGSANALSAGLGGVGNAALLFGLGNKFGFGGGGGTSNAASPAFMSATNATDNLWG